MARVYRRIRDSGGKWVDSADSGPGTWYLDYSDPSGRRIREATLATTKTEALQLLRKKQSEMARAEIAGVTNPEALRMTFEKFLREIYLPHLTGRLRSGTMDTYGDYVDRVSARLGGKLLRQIGKADIKDYISDRLTNGKTKYNTPLAPATINREFSFIRAALYEAQARELIDRNPCARMKLLHEENERTRVMSQLEERKLMGKAPDWVKPIIQVAVLAGLRMGEILRLTWSDVDKERGVIRVSPEAKSHQGREVPITADLVPVFEGIDRRIGKDGACPNVFVDPETGKVLKDWKLGHHYERAVKAAEIVDLHFHDLRRTFASRLAERGVSLQTIADLLGHGATYVTERYAHLKPDTLREAVATLSKATSEVRSDTNLAQAPTLRTADAS